MWVDTPAEAAAIDRNDRAKRERAEKAKQAERVKRAERAKQAKRKERKDKTERVEREEGRRAERGVEHSRGGERGRRGRVAAEEKASGRVGGGMRWQAATAHGRGRREKRSAGRRVERTCKFFRRSASTRALTELGTEAQKQRRMTRSPLRGSGHRK